MLKRLYIPIINFRNDNWITNDQVVPQINSLCKYGRHRLTENNVLIVSGISPTSIKLKCLTLLINSYYAEHIRLIFSYSLHETRQFDCYDKAIGTKRVGRDFYQ